MFAGVTARELCHYFFSPDVRMEWETTVEQASVIEKISKVLYKNVNRDVNRDVYLMTFCDVNSIVQYDVPKIMSHLFPVSR